MRCIVVDVLGLLLVEVVAAVAVIGQDAAATSRNRTPDQSELTNIPRSRTATCIFTMQTTHPGRTTSTTKPPPRQGSAWRRPQ